jgi:hypothetical protein
LLADEIVEVALVRWNCRVGGVDLPAHNALSRQGSLSGSSPPIMLNAAFLTLAIAVLLGTALAFLYLRTEAGQRAPWPLAALHGLLGIGGLGCLLLALRGPSAALNQQNGSFEVMSAILFASAALVGVGIFIMHLLKRRRAGALIAIHATLAVSGFVVLLAYLFAG